MSSSGPAGFRNWSGTVRREALIGLALLAVVACGEEAAPDTTFALGPGADSPTAAVEELHQYLVDGDFVAASSLAVPGQAALASLAEGAAPGDVAESLRSEDTGVAANFWSGFAQGAGQILTGDLTVEESGSQTESGVEFYLVEVDSGDQGSGRLITRDVDGHRIDIFASFGAGLADQLVSPFELMLEGPGEDEALILGSARDVVPSLLVAATDPELSPEAVQGVLRLVEVITRYG